MDPFQCTSVDIENRAADRKQRFSGFQQEQPGHIRGGKAGRNGLPGAVNAMPRAFYQTQQRCAFEIVLRDRLTDIGWQPGCQVTEGPSFKAAQPHGASDTCAGFDLHRRRDLRGGIHETKINDRHMCLEAERHEVFEIS